MLSVISLKEHAIDNYSRFPEMVASGHDIDVNKYLVGEDTSSHHCLGLGLLEDGVSVSILDYCHHEASKSLFVS